MGMIEDYVRVVPTIPAAILSMPIKMNAMETKKA